MSDCQTFEVLHRASADGPLDATRQAAFDAHLADCPACVAKLQNYVLVTEVLKRLETDDQLRPVPLAEGVVQRILAARKAARVAREDRRTG
jgi:anti-sigma factor RsiW